MTKDYTSSKRVRSSLRLRGLSPPEAVEIQPAAVLDPTTTIESDITERATDDTIEGTRDNSQGDTGGTALSEAGGRDRALDPIGITNTSITQIVGTTSMAATSTNHGVRVSGEARSATTTAVTTTNVTMETPTNTQNPTDTDIIAFHKLLGINVETVTDTEAATFKNFNGAMTRLAEANGIDAYVTSTASRGVFHTKFNFVLPEGIKDILNTKKADMIGVEDPDYKVPDVILAQIYDLNKAALGETSDARAGALLRMEIVKAGWHLDLAEVKFVKEGNVTEFIADNTWIVENTAAFNASAFYLPMALEIVFRTTGHHYLSADSANYIAKYNQIFRASLAPSVSGIMAAEDLYHTVTHPINLKFVYSVLRDPTASLRLPNAMVTRANSAPSGTAIITTSAAVLRCLEAGPYYEEILATVGKKVERITRLSDVIKENPAKYHVAFFAYESPGLSLDEKKELEVVKLTAVSCAPILQGFLDAMPKTAVIAKARALSKHADNNPVMRNNVKLFFKAASKFRGATLSEVMNMNVPVTPAVLARSDMDEEE